MNHELNWGLEFDGNRVFEWERGERRKEGTYRLSEKKGNFRIVIHDKSNTIVFPVAVIDKANINVQVNDAWIELTKKEPRR